MIKVKKIRQLMVTPLMLSLMTGCLFAKTEKSKKATYHLPASSTVVKLSEDTSLLKQMSEGIQGIAESSQKGLVYISVSKTHKQPAGVIDPFEFFFGQKHPPMEPHVQKGVGSGFIIDLEKGYILTNNHVVAEADEINLKLANGHTYDGKIVGRDANTDLAVVEILDKKFDRKGLVQLVLADSSKLSSGAFVVALGAPFQLEASITFGIVSAVGRGSLQITQYGDFMQTDAAINPGNSGGPLVDMDGKVVGINTAIASRVGAYNGVGFAIPSNFVRDRAFQLINYGTVDRGFIGIGFAPLSEESVRTLKLPEGTKGVVVTAVKADSPADKAGLEKGDIIVAVGKKSLQSPGDLANVIGLMKPEVKTTVNNYRNGNKKKEIAITIGHWPKSGKLAQASDHKIENGYGLVTEKVADVEARLREQHKVQSEKGLFVAYVKPDSPAKRAGIKIGDVITLVNMSSEPIKSAKAFNDFLSTQKEVVLGLEREGQFFVIHLRKKEAK